MDKILLSSLAAIAVVVLGVACAPAAPPMPAPAPTATPTAPQPAPTSSVSAPDASWARVVQSAKKEGVVTIYAFYYVADIGRAMAKGFQDRYGIRVEILASAGRQTVERVKVERQVKQPVADVVNTGVSSATEISLSGLGESVWRDLPSVQDKSVFLIDPVYSPNGDILFTAFNLLGPFVNTSLVKPQDEPRAFGDLLNPRWKGNILAIDPRLGGSGLFTTITTMRYHKIIEDDYWRRLAPQLKLFGGSSQEQYRMVGRGEYPIGIMASDTSLAPLIAEGAPVKPLALEEGSPAQGESTMVVKGAPHPNAAKLFLDWALAPEGQMVYAKAASVNPLRKGVQGFLIPGASITPKRIVNRTWEAAQAGNDYFKAGIMEDFFGKK